MCCIGCARNSYVGAKPNRTHIDALWISTTGVLKVVKLFAVVLIAATLAACAQSRIVANESELLAAARQPSPENNQNASIVPNRRMAINTKNSMPFVMNKPAAGAQFASFGLASFYAEGTRTASGEKFNPHELTAAHRTLPFGTRLRVTDVATGRSVTVRVNDRGPFVPGRVVDVSYSAAEALGMIGRGVAKVRLAVVQ
jgi:rare lipoprotein A